MLEQAIQERVERRERPSTNSCQPEISPRIRGVASSPHVRTLLEFVGILNRWRQEAPDSDADVAEEGFWETAIRLGLDVGAE